MRKTITGAALAAMVLSAVSAMAAAPVCGDVNDDGSVKTTDALLVLKKAVAQPVDLDCSAYDDQFSACETSLTGANADLTTCNGNLSSTNADLSSTDADLADCRTGPLNLLSFQSHVTAKFDFGGLPSEITVGDAVSFTVTMDMSEATVVKPRAPSCIDYNPGCERRAWKFPVPVRYWLTYSSGHSQAGQVDRIEIENGGVDLRYGTPIEDQIVFYDGYTRIWQASQIDGTWFTDAIPADVATATSHVADPGLFDLTFYLGDWGATDGWGTYHYDYGTPQDKTIVTKAP